MSHSTDNQKGIALVLSVLILSNLMMITLIVADVILRIGKTSREIGESERAYFAAESAVEAAIYDIEKNYDARDLGTESYPSSGALTDTATTWQRYSKPITTTAVICVANNNITYTYSSVADVTDPTKGGDKSCIYTDAPGNITKDNPLRIKLLGQKSFELDFDIATPSGLGFYPLSLDLNWDKSTPGSLVVLDDTNQTVIDTSPSPSQYHTSTLSDTPNLRLRFINDDFTEATYSISPHDSSAGQLLPVGIEIVGKGYYHGQKERIIVLDKKLWKIY